MADPTPPNPNREVELQRTLIDHVPQLEEEIEEVFSQLDEARAERAELQRTLEESQICVCGHLSAMHQGHTIAVGGPNVDYCASLCGCKHFTSATISKLQSELSALKAEVERVRKTWILNYNEAKAQVEELRALMADMVRAFEILEPNEIVNSAVLNRMKAALAKGEAE